jgi:hypothetical protein
MVLGYRALDLLCLVMSFIGLWILCVIDVVEAVDGGCHVLG